MSKLGRTKVVSVRLDPRLYYLATLLGRKDRRTLSSVVEHAVDRLITSRLTTSELALWSTTPKTREHRLAAYHPELLPIGVDTEATDCYPGPHELDTILPTQRAEETNND